MAPGGGIASSCAGWCFSRLWALSAHDQGSLRMVTTQAHIHTCVKKTFPRSEIVLAIGVPLLPMPLKGSPFQNPWPAPLARRVVSDSIHVCFTTMGNPEDKGTHIYLELVDRYRKTYPEDRHVIFHSVGRVPLHRGVLHRGVMSQETLDHFYQDTPVHIYINLDQHPTANGWPLGGEALGHGAIM